ncbi:hypothetical protein ACFSKM_07895 [Ancylobacter dichloromethanicus]
MSTLTDEERAERRAHSRRATERARAIVKPGDMLTFTRCGGHSRGRFTGWDGWWMCSPTRSDISALCVFKLNGAWVTFADEGHWDPHLGDPRRDLDVMSFDPFFSRTKRTPHCCPTPWASRRNGTTAPFAAVGFGAASASGVASNASTRVGPG